MKKEKPRIVFDSNTIISAAMFSGNPAEAINLAFTEQVEGVISAEIIEEIIGVLAVKFYLSQDKLNKLEENLRRDFLNVIPTKRFNIVRDPDDNKIIEAAIEGKCDYIITGDKDLLVLKRYKNIKIVTPTEFLKEFLP